MNASRTSSEPPRPNLRAALLATFLSGTVANAAPSALPDCPDSRDRLPNLEVLTGDLSVEVADNMIRSDGMRPGDEALQDSKVPWLFLTPRVATILQDVFGDDVRSAVAIVEPEETDPNEDDGGSSPLADNLSAPLAEQESPALDESAVLPRFQRQMYRTDI